MGRPLTGALIRKVSRKFPSIAMEDIESYCNFGIVQAMAEYRVPKYVLDNAESHCYAFLRTRAYLRTIDAILKETPTLTSENPRITYDDSTVYCVPYDGASPADCAHSRDILATIGPLLSLREGEYLAAYLHVGSSSRASHDIGTTNQRGCQLMGQIVAKAQRRYRVA
jgi:hypothetical protein